MVFNNYIASADFAPLTDLFRTQGLRQTFSKGACFAVQGRRNRRSGLVESGALRYVHCSDAGERHVVGYAFAGEFVGDYISMCVGRASWVSIEAVCDSRVSVLAGDVLEAFFSTDARHERLGRTVAERMLAEVYERLLQSYALTAQERYERLLDRCPEVLDLVPLHELASYLRVRPETLSRIRARIR